jgi:hypothetical protein
MQILDSSAMNIFHGGCETDYPLLQDCDPFLREMILADSFHIVEKILFPNREKKNAELARCNCRLVSAYDFDDMLVAEFS